MVPVAKEPPRSISVYTLASNECPGSSTRSFGHVTDNFEILKQGMYWLPVSEVPIPGCLHSLWSEVRQGIVAELVGGGGSKCFISVTAGIRRGDRDGGARD